MQGLNRAELLGHLGQDPELVGEEGKVLKLSLATSERFKDAEGNWQDRTSWHKVVVFGNRARALAGILRKGFLVYIEGRLQTRSWEQEGQKRYITQVVAQEVIVCDKRKQEEEPRDRYFMDNEKPTTTQEMFGDDDCPF